MTISLAAIQSHRKSNKKKLALESPIEPSLRSLFHIYSLKKKINKEKVHEKLQSLDRRVKMISIKVLASLRPNRCGMKISIALAKSRMTLETMTFSSLMTTVSIS